MVAVAQKLHKVFVCAFPFVLAHSSPRTVGRSNNSQRVGAQGGPLIRESLGRGGQSHWHQVGDGTPSCVRPASRAVPIDNRLAAVGGLPRSVNRVRNWQVPVVNRPFPREFHHCGVDQNSLRPRCRPGRRPSGKEKVGPRPVSLERVRRFE